MFAAEEFRVERADRQGEVEPVGAGKTFRAFDPGQGLLLPPSLDDWLPADHLARFVADLVDEHLDLSRIYVSYQEGRGAPPYDPRLMVRLLIFGYTTGVRSSRGIEKACTDIVAFRWLAAGAAPDYRAIARFRKRHLAALGNLFLQALALCQAAGMVTLGQVALDGTKLRANASKRKAMSYARLTDKEKVLAQEVSDLLAAAEARHVAADAGSRFPGIAATAGPVDMHGLVGGKQDLVEAMRSEKYIDVAEAYGWPVRQGEAAFAGTPDASVLEVTAADGTERWFGSIAAATSDMASIGSSDGWYSTSLLMSATPWTVRVVVPMPSTDTPSSRRKDGRRRGSGLGRAGNLPTCSGWPLRRTCSICSVEIDSVEASPTRSVRATCSRAWTRRSRACRSMSRRTSPRRWPVASTRAS